MFSGIIQTTATIRSILPHAEGYHITLSIHDPREDISIGSSVAVDGICLTIKEILSPTELLFEAMPETLRKTSLSSKKAEDTVNIEYSLRMGDEIGGHHVFGHIDGIGTVTKIHDEGEARIITFTPQANLMDFLTYQGSIAVNGVSLTVASIQDTSFTVSLIEHTQKVTNLGNLTIGDTVNVECDMIIKYVHRYLQDISLNKN